MRFLILNSDYHRFLDWLYGVNDGLEDSPFETQAQVRADSLFGVADFYSRNLRALGHEALDIYVNNFAMQSAWAREHGLRIPQIPAADSSMSSTKFFAKRLMGAAMRKIGAHQIGIPRGWNDILAAQIEHFKPDVLLNQTMDGLDSRFLAKVKNRSLLLVGQHAAPRLPRQTWDCYDFFISSNPLWVERFRNLGIPADLHRLGFEPEVLPSLTDVSQSSQVSFVGSLFDVHSTRIGWLEEVITELMASSVDIAVWGDSAENLPESSSIRRVYRGIAWGIEMYRILHSSAITLNHHGDGAFFANNLRLYESTGVGTLLITDQKPNLAEMFRVGEEVIAYETPAECAREAIRLLDDEETRRFLAAQGQKRTLEEHNYRRRMEQLVELVGKRLESK